MVQPRLTQPSPAPAPPGQADQAARAGGGTGGLVGRDRELAALRERLAAAAAGHGGVVAIGGEPGIGKTHLAQAAIAPAAGAGAPVLWGRGYEGDWAPPYGPWVEVFTDLLRAVPPGRPAEIAACLGPGTPALAALVPSLRERLPAQQAPAPLSPEEERFRLHDAAARFLLAALAADGPAPLPAIVVLDDLQWVDRPSLALLLHLARLLDETRLLLVATYRDGALDRDHPLTETLAALRREPGFLPLTLKGLDQAAVAALVVQAVRREVTPELGRAIHGETNGNPFYVREVTRHLLDEGALVERTGATGDVSIRDLGVPEGVRQVVGRRLARLSDPARRVLAGAALFTAGVDFPILLALTELPEEALLDALDEAINAQFLRPVDHRQERYDFGHSIVRQALIAEQRRNPSRAARLHRRAAAAIAAAHGDRPGVAAELAIQYHASAALPGAAQGVPHALAAAEQARAAYAAEQAVVFLRIARDLSGDFDPGSRGSILCKLATAEAEALDLAAAETTTHQALDALLRSQTAPERVAAFLENLAAALKLSGAEDTLWRPLVEQGLSLVGEDHGLTWARLTLLRDPVAPIPSETVRASRWLGFDPEAVRIARLLGDEEDYAHTIDSFDARTRDETRALIALARTWTRPTAALRVMSAAANDFQYRHGAFREAMAVWEDVESAARRYGAVSWEAQAVGQETFLHLAFGDTARARETEARAAELTARLGPLGGAAGEPDALRLERATAFALYLDGDWSAIASEWIRVLGEEAVYGNYVTGLNGAPYAGLAALSCARAGRREQALGFVAALVSISSKLDRARGNQALNGGIAFGADALWTLGVGADAPALRHLAHTLLAAGIGDYPQCSTELSIARLAVLRGDPAEARDSFARARATLETGGQRPLRAIVDHDEALAAVRFDIGNRRDARSLAAAARDAFVALDLSGWAARSQQLVEAVAGQTSRPPHPAGLSDREAEVLRLVARGFSDRQIADVLFVSPRTVNAHVRNLLMKTERANRTELSVWAVEHGLVAATAG